MMGNFDANELVSETIEDIDKEGIVSDIFGIEKVINIEGTKKRYSYMIFALQRLKEKHGMDYEMITMLNYLYELSIFSHKIKIENKVFNISEYLKFGLIYRDYKVKRKSLYRLTENAISIVEEYDSIMNNYQDNIEKNRDAETDSETKMKSVLSKFIGK